MAPKNVGHEKQLGLLVSKSLIGKHAYATIRFLVCSLIVDFVGVLVLVLFLLVTWFLGTPHLRLLVYPLQIGFGEGCSCSCSSCCDIVTGVKQSQLLG